MDFEVLQLVIQPADGDDDPREARPMIKDGPMYERALGTSGSARVLSLDALNAS